MVFFVVANWKMNGNYELLRQHLSSLNENFCSKISDDLKVIICPPFIALQKDCFNVKNFIQIGAQNCYHQENGPYTGEVSAKMLYEIGCRYVIIGHSERRKFLNETNLDIKLKAENAISHNLTPIICIGETLLEKESGQIKRVLSKQCEESLPKNGSYIIAYEPIWSIGTGIIPEISSIEESVDYISKYSNNNSILYGGSVNESNINNLLESKKINGFLIGNASLNIKNFSNIISKAIDR